MHVLLVPSWYPTRERPLAGSFFREQAQMLHRKGHQVGVLFPSLGRFFERLPRTSEARQPIDHDDGGIPTAYHFRRRVVPWLPDLSDRIFADSVRAAAKPYVAECGRPDLIHSHALLHGGVVGRVLSRQLDVPWVHTEHLSLLTTSSPSPYLRRCVKRVLGGAERCIVVSRSFKGDLIARYGLDPQTLEVIPNLVAPRFLQAAPMPRQAGFVFFSNAFLRPEKNHSLLIDAFAKLCVREPACRLRIGGAPHGISVAQIEALAEASGVGDRIDVLGGLDRQQVARELEGCHAFVLASRYETFGVALIEALAMGRPVVATDCGGPRDIVGPGDGVLVEHHTADALADAMLRMVAEIDRYEPAALSERCRARFGEDAVGDRILRTYQALVRREPAPSGAPGD